APRAPQSRAAAAARCDSRAAARRCGRSAGESRKVTGGRRAPRGMPVRATPWRAPLAMSRRSRTRRRRRSGIQVIAMLLRDFSKPVLIANLAAWPLAYLVSQAYLSVFMQRIAITPLPFVISLLVAVGIAWLAV